MNSNSAAAPIIKYIAMLLLALAWAGVLSTGLPCKALVMPAAVVVKLPRPFVKEENQLPDVGELGVVPGVVTVLVGVSIRLSETSPR